MIVRLPQSQIIGKSAEIKPIRVYRVIETPRTESGIRMVKIKPVNYDGTVLGSADEIDMPTFFNTEGDI